MRKNFIAPIFAAALLLSNGITAFAAPEVINVNGVPTVFDAEYYAAANPDIAAEIGRGKDALIRHYTMFGKSEKRAAYAPGTDVNALLASASAAAPVQKKKIKSKTEFYSDGGKTDYEYDEKGNLLTKTFSGRNGRTDISTYTYDARGNILTEIIKRDIYSAQVHTHTYVYSYDEHDNVVKYTSIDNEGDIASYAYAYVYDGNSNILMKSSKKDTSFVTMAYAYTYDEHGNLLTEIHERHGGDEDPSISYIYTYTYDEYDNLLTSNMESLYDGSYTATTYTYDEHGNVLTETEKSDNIYANHTAAYTYDSEGNVLTKTFDDGSIYIYTYTYF